MSFYSTQQRWGQRSTKQPAAASFRQQDVCSAVNQLLCWCLISIFCDVISFVSTTLSLVRMWWQQVKCIRLVNVMHDHQAPDERTSALCGQDWKERKDEWESVFEAFHLLHSCQGRETITPTPTRAKLSNSKSVREVCSVKSIISIYF